MRVINKETGKRANVKTFRTSYYDKKSQAMTKIEFEKMLAKLDIDPDDKRPFYSLFLRLLFILFCSISAFICFSYKRLASTRNRNFRFIMPARGGIRS